MRLLLDTHTFIWWTQTPRLLPQTVYDALEDSSNEILLSVVSVWEIQIKVQLGKLDIGNAPLQQTVQAQTQSNRLRLLPIVAEHVYALDGLPFHHKDPFDRLLIAQAIYEQALLVSRDHVFTAYSVPLLW